MWLLQGLWYIVERAKDSGETLRILCSGDGARGHGTGLRGTHPGEGVGVPGARGEGESTLSDVTVI